MHIIIIGAGPAGISAALYARRSGADVTVIAKDGGALGGAELVENYYGMSEPVSGTELAQRGIAGAKRLGVCFAEDEVLAAQQTVAGTEFTVEGMQASYYGDALILAAGAARRSLAVPGVQEFEGRGVSYCAVCDAYFYRGKSVAVIGAGAYALHEAQILLPHAERVFLLTDGGVLTAEVSPQIEVVAERIVRITGEKRVGGVSLEDGRAIPVDGVFMAIGTAGSSDLARKMGVLLDAASIIVGRHMETNVPGVYAAGDCTGGLLQIAKAVYEGAEAGLAAVRYLHGR